MKSSLKKLLPEQIFLAYHYALAIIGTLLYGLPSRKMMVIGVTGTKGKTSTSNFIWSVLQASGYATGLISTAIIRVGKESRPNTYHMTMPGRFRMQKLLRQMVTAGCTHCVIETSSEGIKQSRHVGIAYDIAVFTNLTPEHLASHRGSFETYKQTKGKLFAALAAYPRKTIQGKKMDKVIIANHDSPHAAYFLSFAADEKFTFGAKEGADYRVTNIKTLPRGVSFSLDARDFSVHTLGEFNALNAAPAIIIGTLFGVPDNRIQAGFNGLTVIPGRMELIEEGQPFTVIVDYAHEQESIAAVLKTARQMRPPGGRIIVIFGGVGGGRDTTKRPLMGKLAGEYADLVILTNDDPYSDDPQEIMEDIARAAESAGKVRETNLFLIQDRGKAIQKAVEDARSGDIVLILGKGAEQSMAISGYYVPWDDRTVVREEIRNLKQI